MYTHIDPMGCVDGSTDKGACHHARLSEFGPPRPTQWREKPPAVTCPLNSVCMPWYTGAKTHVDKNNLNCSISMFSYVCVRQPWMPREGLLV